MEITKFISKLGKLQDAFNCDLQNILSTLENDYDIFIKGTSQKINMKQFIEQCQIKPPNRETCIAVTKNGNLCSKKALTGTTYCTLHRMSHYKQQLISNKVTSVQLLCNDNVDEHISCLPKMFIDDEFFYCDKEYLYDTLTCERVGYFDGDKWHLTSDPFLLGHFV